MVHHTQVIVESADSLHCFQYTKLHSLHLDCDSASFPASLLLGHGCSLVPRREDSSRRHHRRFVVFIVSTGHGWCGSLVNPIANSTRVRAIKRILRSGPSKRATNQQPATAANRSLTGGPSESSLLAFSLRKLVRLGYLLSTSPILVDLQ